MDFDGTRNLFIEAENLEALKILQKAYAGSVKMIYIDPPYNTGSDSFIYPDKFSETRDEYARRVGDKDAEGYLKRDGVFQGAWRKNSKDSGHYHSNWLSMMLPRLHLARTLLRDDGVIFISIDDNEQAQLKLLCDEVFGAENFVSTICHKSRASVSNDKIISSNHNFLLLYAKNQQTLFKNREHFGISADLSSYTKIDENGDAYKLTPVDGPGGAAKGNPYYEFQGVVGYWRYSKETMQELYDKGEIVVTKNNLQRKTYLKNMENKRQTVTTWWEDGFLTSNATRELDTLMGNKYFDNPKNINLLHRCLELSCQKEDLVMDFFSGSGTTAHAVMQLNAEDGGKRRYLCVQLPEETDEKSEARKAGFDNIAEIAKERIRRAGKQVSDSLKEGQKVDTGFKVFKLSESSFKQWRQPENMADLDTQIEMFVNSVQDNAAPENMLYELMLRLGCKLTSPVEHKNGVYWVTDEDTGKRIALLLESANQTLIDEVIAAAPTKVVALDKWFDGNDALKSNTVLQMKDAGIVFECV